VTWGEFLAGAYLMQHMVSGEIDFGSGAACRS
jgi:ABC-type nitrate/sulfonate/bicarbonate transport system substrate-binding protein